jgi:hypothetical protein
MRRPSQTTAALATTARLAKPSIRAWLPYAISAGLTRRRPPRRRIRAAVSLPTNPIAGCGQHGEVVDRVRVEEPIEVAGALLGGARA